MRTVCSLGPVRGKTGKYGLCFLGVPYGKARRFQPAMPCDPWTGERDCTHFGPFAFETDEKENEWQTHGEDCLNLNIFTPSCEGSRPVLVNLHGGAFQNGAADRVEPFSGEFVYVDVNYRLGVWGFLQIGASSGNNGIGDQILALQWIQREIACFGGDPRRVTVMGLSAGAKSIGALLAAPAARVLFSQAILSSGGTQSIRSRKTAGHIAREFFRFAGCESDPSVLFTMKNEDLLRAQDATCDTMNEGRVVIHGSCGDAAGYGMRGGQLLIRDNVGYRAGIHMKAYKEQQPLIMVGGMAGSFLAEYQAGGTIIVLGLNNHEKPAPIGALCCAGMHGGRLFLRCNEKPTDFDDHIFVNKATEGDMQSIEAYLRDFCDTFDISYEEVLSKDFYVITPNTSNPYKALYTKNCV